MNLILLLYPISLVVIVLFYYVLYRYFYNMYGVILCFLSIMKYISIAPLITWINDIIYEWWKDDFIRIKQNIKDTFIVKGNTTNTKQAIYLLHPHGICSLTHVFHINTEITNWTHRNIYCVMSHLIAYIPFINDLVNRHERVISSGYSTIKNTLQEKKSISMCLGNFTEGKYDDEHRISVIVKKRNGIFKIAIETGVPIIPVLSYGEQSVFTQYHSFGINRMIYDLTGIQINCPTFSSIADWIDIYHKPLDKKIITYIGDPIEVGEARTPTSTDIHDLRNKYMEALRTLYRTTKPDDYEDEIVFI